jgi:hypothetical protein
LRACLAKNGPDPQQSRHHSRIGQPAKPESGICTKRRLLLGKLTTVLEELLSVYRQQQRAMAKNDPAFPALLQGEPKTDDILASDCLREPKPKDVGSAANLAIDKPRLDKMLCAPSHRRRSFGPWAKTDDGYPEVAAV